MEGRESVAVKCRVESEEHPRTARFTVLDDEEPVISVGRLVTPGFYNVSGKVAVKGNRIAVGGWIYTNAVPGLMEPSFGVILGEFDRPSTFRKVFDATGFFYFVTLAWTEENKLLIKAVTGEPRTIMAVLNEDGSIETNITPTEEALLNGEKFQSDGKRIVLEQTDYRSNLVRLLANGVRDDSFHGLTNTMISEFTILPDDKILIEGPFQTVHGIYRPGGARLNPDGTVDLGFNPENGQSDYFPRGDGRVLVASRGNGWSLLNADGSLNRQLVLERAESFQPAALLEDGRVITSDLRIVPAFNTDLSSVILNPRSIRIEEGSGPLNLSAHRIGNVSRAETVPLSMELVQGEQDGDLTLSAETISFEAMERDATITIEARGDSTMEIDEVYRLSAGVPESNLVSDSSLEVKIIDRNVRPGAAVPVKDLDADYGLSARMGGGLWLLGASSKALAIFNPMDGSVFKTELPLSQDRFLSMIAPFGDGVLVGGGFYGTTNEPMGGLFRLNKDGTIDSTFSSQALPLMPKNARVRSDGGLIITGYRSYAPEGLSGNVLLLSSNGIVERSLQVPLSIYADAVPLTDTEVLYYYPYYEVPPTPGPAITFAAIRLYDIVARKEVTGFKPVSLKGYIFSLMPTAKGILVAGQFESINGVPRRNVARLLFNGEVDPSFNASVERVSNVAPVVDSKGGILLSGYLVSVNGVPRSGLARLESDGSLDLAFDPGNSLDNGLTTGFITSIGEMENGNFLALEYFPNSTLPARAVTIASEPAFRAGIKQQGSSVTLEFVVVPEVSYQIETSSDLVQWQTLATTNSTGYQLRLELPTQRTRQFFRAKR